MYWLPSTAPVDGGESPNSNDPGPVIASAHDGMYVGYSHPGTGKWDEDGPMYFDGTTWASAGTSPNPVILDTWQKWEFDYTTGENTFTLTIDGESKTLPAWSPNAWFYRLEFNTWQKDADDGFPPNWLRMTHIDAVPEPATLDMVLVCGLLLLARGYRRVRAR